MPATDVVEAVKQWEPKAKAYRLLNAYRIGDHDLKLVTEPFKARYGEIVADSRENLCPTVIAAHTDRIQIESWGDDSDEQTADRLGLDLIAGLVHTEAYAAGNAYLMIWPGKTGEPTPVFIPGNQIIATPDPLDPSELVSAAKIWTDPATSRGRVNIYTDRHVERWTTTEKIDETGTLPDTPTAWTPYNLDGQPPEISHPFGVVPVCWFKQNPSSQTAPGRSILADVIPLQDELNQIRANLIVIGQSYANQFWVLFNHQTNPTNPLALSVDGTTPHGTTINNPATALDPTRRTVATTDGPGPLTQITPPDVTHMIALRDSCKQAIAAVTGIPPYYFTPTSGDIPSGESLRVLTSRLTASVESFQATVTPAWAKAKRLLGLTDTRIRWRPAMPLDVAERVAIAEAKKAIGYHLADAIEILDEADPGGIVQRATQAANDTSQALLAGALTYQT